MRKIGLLGGSFDPIHHGHLNLAFELSEKKKLDEVWFIPTALNPHKTNSPPIALQHRINMISLAIKAIPYFAVKDVQHIETYSSYTIHMLKYFIEQASFDPIATQFYLMMGEDIIARFAEWYLPDEIVQLVPLLIGCRSETAIIYPTMNLSPFIYEAIQSGRTKTKLMDISSTDIRYRLQSGLYCEHLTSYQILEYIHKNHIY